MSRATGILLLLTGIGAASATAAVPDERWQVESASGRIAFHSELIRDLGIQVSPASAPDANGRLGVAFRASGRIELVAPGSLFQDLADGELRLDSRGILELNGTELALQDVRLRRGAEERTLALLAPDGRPLFEGDYMHFKVDRQAGTIRMFNIDLRLTPDAARLLGDQRYAGVAIGVLELTAPVAIPRGSVETPNGACSNPNWGAPNNDVALINIGSVQQMARLGTFPTGQIAVAPSATLKNVGSTEVPWYGKFSGTFPPYNNDQHPQLVWNMYRIANGAVEQIGVSPLKHAFLTVNSNCGCPSGNILWVTCEDTYGTGTNDSLNDLGPRDEVTAHTGVWDRCGSIFDPDCNGVQNSPPPRTGPMDRRMAVLESDLQIPGAVYYVDSWYIVRDDVNIFNTMGWRTVTPIGGTTWTFTLGGALTPGAVIDQWVNPITPGPNAQSVQLDTAEGRLRLAVRATDLGGGQWRYEYALMNFDQDLRVKSFTVPLPAGATPTGIGFHDVDNNAATDWTASVGGGVITWGAPNNAASQDYSTLFNFRFTTNAMPSAPGAVNVPLVFTEARLRRSLAILGPGTVTGPGPFAVR